MGTSYSGGVFFGACVPPNHPLSAKLRVYLERSGYSPAPTEIEGVEIAEVGSFPTGATWVTVQATGSAQSYGRDDGDCPVPLLLVAPAMWRTEIGRFLDTLEDPAASTLQVGWHFQGSAS